MRNEKTPSKTRSVSVIFVIELKKQLYTWEADRHYIKTTPSPQIIHLHKCEICQKECNAPGILALHKIQEHNVYPESHYYINTHWCPICMHDFESIVRVREHIDQTHHPDKIGHISCFDIIKKEYTKLTEEQLEQVKIDVKNNKALQKTFALFTGPPLEYEYSAINFKVPVS